MVTMGDVFRKGASYCVGFAKQCSNQRRNVKRIVTMENDVTIRTSFAAAALLAVLAAPIASQAATVVVTHDEWTLSTTGFAQSPDASIFVQNLVAEFGTRIHAYSTNFGLNNSALSSAMATAGATFSAGTGFALTAANLVGIDAVMLAGNYLNAGELAELSSFVAGGGSVYIAGGTGLGGAAAEAAAWNGFLAPFGIQMSGAGYDGVGGNLSVTSATDPLFAGITTLYSNNGNALSGTGVVCCGDRGLYAVWRSDDPAPVPLPATGALLIGALGGVAALRRRQKA